MRWKNSHPCQEKEHSSDLSCDRTAHEHGGVDDVMDATVPHTKLVHDIGII